MVPAVVVAYPYPGPPRPGRSPVVPARCARRPRWPAAPGRGRASRGIENGGHEGRGRWNGVRREHHIALPQALGRCMERRFPGYAVAAVTAVAEPGNI